MQANMESLIRFDQDQITDIPVQAHLSLDHATNDCYECWTDISQ